MQSTHGHLDLAHAEAFALGTLWLDPASRLVRNGASSRIIEPRVMRLLVALHSAKGRVLSRDDLMESCWGGVVVGENAIHRAVSQARNIASTTGSGSFSIETVRGVGYRLIEHLGTAKAATDEAIPEHRTFPRRSVLALVGTGAVAAIAVPVAFLTPSGSAANRSARQLYERGEVALRDESYPSNDQAISLLKEAISQSPQFAEAWSALAVAYWGSLFGPRHEQADHYALLAQAAAKRALALDPRQNPARVALIMVERDYRDARGTRAQLAEIDVKPADHWIVHRARAMVDADLGDWGLAIRDFERALEAQPLLPVVQANLARAYWAAGRVMDADQTLARANRQWPKNYTVWEFTFRYLALTGQYEKAAAHLSDDYRIPLGLGPVAIEKRTRLLSSLQGGPDRNFVLQVYRRELRDNPLNTTRAVPFFAMLGWQNDMFELLEDYFFGQQRQSAERSRYARRPTYFLFLPPMRRFHGEKRFTTLLSSIGLAERM